MMAAAWPMLVAVVAAVGVVGGGARLCSNADTVLVTADGLSFNTIHSLYGLQCWDPTTYSGFAYVNVSACDPLSAEWEAEINGGPALIQRGGCSFADKSKNAQNANASLVLIFNNDLAPPSPFLRDDGAFCIGSATEPCGEVCDFNCPGVGASLPVTIPTLFLSKDDGLYLVNNQQNFTIDCPGTPQEAQCGSLAPTSAPTANPSFFPSFFPTTTYPTGINETFSPTSPPSTTRPTTTPSLSPSTRGPTRDGETFQPTISPSTSRPTSLPTMLPTTAMPSLAPTSSAPSGSPSKSPTPTPTSSPTAYAGPALDLGFNITNFNTTELADLEAAVLSLIEDTLNGLDIFSNVDLRVDILQNGSVRVVFLNSSYIARQDVDSLAAELNADNATVSGGFGFLVVAASSIAAPTMAPTTLAPTTAVPTASPVPPEPASEGFWTDRVITGFIIAGVLLLLILLNVYFYVAFRKKGPMYSEAEQLERDSPIDRHQTGPQSSSSGRGRGHSHKSSVNLNNPHYYPEQPVIDNAAYEPLYDNRVNTARPGHASAPGPHKWYPKGANGYNRNYKRPPVRAPKKIHEPGQSVLAQVGARPWQLPDGSGRR